MKLLLMLGKPKVTGCGGNITLTTGGPGTYTFFKEMGPCGSPIPHHFTQCEEAFRPGTKVRVISKGNLYRGQEFIVEARKPSTAFSDHAARVACKSVDKLNHFSYSFRRDELQVVDEAADDPLVCPAKAASDLDRGHNFMKRPDQGAQECIACGHQTDSDNLEWQEEGDGTMWWSFKRDNFRISISKYVNSYEEVQMHLAEKKNDGIFCGVASNQMKLPQDKRSRILAAIKWAESFIDHRDNWTESEEDKDAVS